MKLALIKCQGCQAPLPLGVPAPQIACPHCGAQNTLAPNYVEAATIRRQEAEARRQIEPLWQRLGQGAPSWAGYAAFGLVVLLPPLATWLGLLLSEFSVAGVTAVVSLPALLPGAALWVWSGAVSATTLRFRAAMAAQPPKGDKDPPGCRNCGAPLQVEEGALAATCGYCGVDSLLEKIDVKSVARGLKEALGSLVDAAKKLRARRAILALGAFGVALFVGGSSALLWLVLMKMG